MNRRPGHVTVTVETGYCSFCGRPRNLRREEHQLGTLVRTIITCETCHRTLSSSVGVAQPGPAPAEPPAKIEAQATAKPEAEPKPAAAGKSARAATKSATKTATKAAARTAKPASTAARKVTRTAKKK
jgi:hypothetical protein